MAFSESRPWRSVTCGCNPGDEARRLTEEVRKAYGVTSAWYDPKTGEACASDQKGRNALIRHNGGVDKQGGYGDWTGK